MITLLVAAAIVAAIAGGATVAANLLDRREAEREAAAHIIDMQRDHISRLESRERGHPGQGQRSADLTEDPHDEAFQAAWIDSSQEVIDRIDRELGIKPAPILDDAPAPTPLQRRTGYQPGQAPPLRADDAWKREPDGSWSPTPKALQVLEIEEQDVVAMHGDEIVTKVLRIAGFPTAFWGD